MSQPRGPAQAAPGGGRTLLLAIGLASGAALAYQILLLRLFAIVQFHHTAYMVISLALLGYGASGTVLTLGRDWWMRHFEVVFPACLATFGLGSVACFALGQRIGLHPEELLWDPRQMASLLLMYLLLALPFFFVGAAVGAALMRFSVSRIYAADLVGAGLGAGVVVGLLWLLTPGEVLRVVAVVALGAAIVARSTPVSVGVGAFSALAILLLPATWVEPRPSQYKGLSQALRVKGARLVDQRSNPLALVSAVESPEVPLRHVPGLSLAVPTEPPEQVGLFLDAEALTPILHRRQGSVRMAALGYTTSALPYALTQPSSVLVLGAGGGEEVARARYHGVDSVVAVEVNRDVVGLVRTEYDTYSGGLYTAAGVEVVTEDLRGFSARADSQFDIVVLAAASGYGGGGPALASLSEDYLLTVEALDSYLDLVTPGGFLTVTVYVNSPPRDILKLTATARSALERRGVEAPAQSLAVIRGWQTATMVVKHGPITDDERSRLEEFCERRLFDVVYQPGMVQEQANRHNRLPRSAAGILPSEAVRRLLGPERDAFLERYKFAAHPPTDDRPFFHQFFRWRALPDLVAARGSGGLSLLEAGYLVLVATLLIAIASAVAFILLPLRWLPSARSSIRRSSVVVYFTALGLGFLLLEVALLQKLILILQHPVYSAAVVLGTFLVFAGCGSATARRVEARMGRCTVPVIGAGIALAGALVTIVLSLTSSSVAGAAMPVRVVFAVALVAPLAYLLGMPFPLGLDRLKAEAPGLVPWAWAVNGCASVVSPILATLIAIHWGFYTVIGLAILCYALVASVRLGPARASMSP